MPLPVLQGKDEILESNNLLEKFHEEKEAALVEVAHPLKSASIREVRLPPWSVFSRSWRRLLFFLLPSFIQNWLRPELAKADRLYPTSYLDGLRGLAAFLVFFFHFSYSCHDTNSAYGEAGKNKEFLKLPFIRFLYTGTAMVSIFFVVSGFALSYKPVKLMRSKRWSELLHGLSSAVFRRAMRLYLPCLVSTFIIAITVYMGVYEGTRKLAWDEHRLVYHREAHLRQANTLYEQILDWGHKMFTMFHPWSFGNWNGQVDIDGHLWTIAVEFRSSIILYVTQLGVCRMKPALRILVLVLTISWCVYKDRWEMILFYGGFILAELDLRRRESSTLPSFNSSTTTPKRDRVWSWLYMCVFLIGIYLCGQPGHQVGPALGWNTLHSWIPSYWQDKHRFWTGWGAILLVWAVSNDTFLQRLFTNSFAQYLGKISFSLYVVHAHVIHTIGYKTLDVLWNRFGYEDMLMKEMSFCISTVITVTVAIWAADIFMRLVDTPSIHLAKWFEEKSIVRLQDDS